MLSLPCLTRLWLVGLVVFMLSVAPALAAKPRSIAVLGVEFIDTSPGWQGKAGAGELKRIDDVHTILLESLAEAGYNMIAPALVAEMVRPVRELQMLDRCNGCDVALGRQLNADWVLVVWVQKVSNLILNLNIIVRDSVTGKDIAGAFVDFRGNTDESWRRAVRYALKNILLPRLGRIIDDRA